MKKPNYASMFTKRKDGTYQKYVNGKYLYSKDPEVLYQKWIDFTKNPTGKIFRFVAEKWSEEHREQISIRTWLNYNPHYVNLVDRFGSRSIDEITAQEIQSDLLRYKAQGYSATILRTRRKLWNQIFDYAVLHDYVKYNPVTSVRIPKGLPKSKRSAPSDEEIRIVFENINKPFGFFPFFLLCTGLRKSEALALLKSDIDLDRREIKISKTLVYIDNANPSVKAPKTESGNRTVPILDILYPHLVKHLTNINTEVVFPSNKSNRNPGGGYMTERAYDVAWANYCKETGLNITAHQLRHGTATLMFEAGVDVYTAQHILGHANINKTMAIYTELREKQKALSIEKLNSYMAKI